MKASPSDTAAPASRSNPGETLRHEREKQGLTLAVIARQLHLSERALLQIEAGDFSQLPGHTFARGYVRAYAKALGLDPSRLVAEFDVYTGTDARGSQVQSLGRIDEPIRLSAFGLRLLSFILLLVFAGVAFYWWQERGASMMDMYAPNVLEHIEVDSADGTTQIHPLDEPEDQAVQESMQSTDEPTEQRILPLDGESPEPSGAPVPPPIAEGSRSAETQAPAQPVPPPTAPRATEPAPVIAPAVPAAPATSPSAQPLAPGQASLTLQFTADCWTQVSDATGRVLFSALMHAGSSREVQGQPPFSVHLGYARGVQVTYNGNAVDLTPHIKKGGTARLQLGQP